MVFKKRCVLVLWTKVGSALEGLEHHFYVAIVIRNITKNSQAFSVLHLTAMCIG